MCVWHSHHDLWHLCLCCVSTVCVCLFVNDYASASTVMWKKYTYICIWLNYLLKWRQSTNPSIAPTTHMKRTALHTDCPCLLSADQANICANVNKDVCAFCWVAVWVCMCVLRWAFCVCGSINDQPFITNTTKLYNVSYGNIRRNLQKHHKG